MARPTARTSLNNKTTGSYGREIFHKPAVRLNATVPGVHVDHDKIVAHQYAVTSLKLVHLVHCGELVFVPFRGYDPGAYARMFEHDGFRVVYMAVRPTAFTLPAGVHVKYGHDPVAGVYKFHMMHIISNSIPTSIP